MEKMSAEALYLYTIYDSPIDAPGKFVIRRFEMSARTSFVLRAMEARICDSLEQARALVPLGLLRMPAAPDDEPQIVEIWL